MLMPANRQYRATSDNSVGGPSVDNVCPAVVAAQAPDTDN